MLNCVAQEVAFISKSTLAASPWGELASCKQALYLCEHLRCTKNVSKQGCTRRFGAHVFFGCFKGGWGTSSPSCGASSVVPGSSEVKGWCKQACKFEGSLAPADSAVKPHRCLRQGQVLDPSFLQMAGLYLGLKDTYGASDWPDFTVGYCKSIRLLTWARSEDRTA